ncbi:LysR substrate-binding domain protein [Bordetella bronchiseptica SBL-F6116]|uniref:LysR family transcriptional regulator n=1 Tax=Bordetella bronchiseptica TaxID=518 RepID=UPI000459896A|nr:LysR family transcriptional regulator [Bordetella bronchiseptica]KCV24851.1 LysR substrate-binding domain protein [Bordetella bronchiseptica 00-P-2730]KDD98859.1 LysR substrate-binding domain protein [Bordetella bronchiseptica SBL-F6116]
MTLKQLEAFYWAATCASFAVAADRLHLSLSSLSKRIAELESALGLDLFDRSGHRAVLTAAGERLLPQARDLLASADRIRASLRAEPELGVRCRFGVGELSALTWLPRLIGRVRGRYPGLALEPYVDVGQVLKRKVAEGELDFAVVAGASSHSAIASAPVGQAHFAWVAAPSVAGAAQGLTPQLLAGTALVSLPDGAGTTRLLDPWLAGGAPAGPRLACNNWGAIVGMLLEGMGIGLLPRHWAQALARDGALRILASDPEPVPLHYAFHWRRDDTRPLVAAMRDQVLLSVDFAAPCRLP